MRTIKEVAQQANVSVATVSRVINKSGYVKEATRKRIEQVIKELDYYPNETVRTLFTKKSKTIGLLLPDMSNPFFTIVAKGVEDTAIQKGYHVMIGNGEMQEHKELNYLTTFKVNNCSGVIASQLSTQFAFDQFNSYQLPYVLIDRVTDNQQCIEADHYKGGKLQAETIIKGNAQRVLLLHQDLNYRSFEERFNGARTTLKNHDIQLWIEDEHDITIDKLKAYVNYNHIDSVICSNDVSALKIMKWLHDLHFHIPYDVQVIGYDDIPLAKLFYPSLTTIEQPAYEIGKQAALGLINQLEHNDVTTKVVLDVDVIHRESTRRKK
ncbi:LacI family DNA-binding transcriptional regulator [Staphylococcus sp. EG-SA-6]|nr:LacI family DNA-binding transcriptional regulator [Staphylococcus sp. EG-SA-6]